MHFNILEEVLDQYYWMDLSVMAVKVYYLSALIMELEFIIVIIVKMLVFYVFQV